MPIKINLLAEAREAAEMRRKDPVKRGIWVGCFLVLAVVLWIAKLQMDIMFETTNFNRVEGEWKAKLSKFSTVTNEQARTVDVDKKLAALDTLSTNRFLWAPVLNALQKTVIDSVQVTKFRGQQNFVHEQAHTTGSGSHRMIVPAAVIEQDTIYIEAKDLRPSEESYIKYKDLLCNAPFFVKNLKRRDGFVLDGTLGPLTVDPVDPSRQFVTFTLAAHFPEVRRSE